MAICVGIDFSITSPGLCVHEGDDWNPECCTFHGLEGRKTFPEREGVIELVRYPEWKTDSERYGNLAQWALERIPPGSVIGLENFAMHAVGRMTAIAENVGVLKYRLFDEHHSEPVLVSPTRIKKCATGNGRSSKEDMLAAFEKETGLDPELAAKAREDIADAYFICKYVHAAYFGLEYADPA